MRDKVSVDHGSWIMGGWRWGGDGDGDGDGMR